MGLFGNATTELRRDYTTDIYRTIVAFANTEGGTLFLGVAPDGTIAGVPDANATILRVANGVRDVVKPDLGGYIDYQAETVEGRPVVAVIVQRGAGSPYFIADRGLRPAGVYLRQGTSSVPASETAILEMIRQTDGAKYEGMRSLVQELTFEAAEREFEARGIPFGLSPRKALKLMTADGVYTNLGLLLSDQCPHTVKLAVFGGTTKNVFRERREFTGSLLKQLNDIWEFVNRYNPIRAERRDYPVAAVSEALLNALVHRDYAYGGSTMIAFFGDRLEFVSLGGLAGGVSFEDIMLGVPVARNENLANVFYGLALTVAYGTGMQKITGGYDGFHKKPRIEVTENAFKVTLPNVNASEEESRLSDYERTVTALFEARESIARKDAERALSLSQAMAVRILRGLVEKGEIRTVGNGKNTRYVSAR